MELLADATLLSGCIFSVSIGTVGKRVHHKKRVRSYLGTLQGEREGDSDP